MAGMGRQSLRGGFRAAKLSNEWELASLRRSGSTAKPCRRNSSFAAVRSAGASSKTTSRHREWAKAVARPRRTAASCPSTSSLSRVGGGKSPWEINASPLATWTEEMVWTYVRAHDVPYNELHDRGYPSIGCTTCTVRVNAGDPLRAGRWQGFAKTECGLHR